MMEQLGQAPDVAASPVSPQVPTPPANARDDRWVMSQVVEGLLMIADSIEAHAGQESSPG